MDPRTQRDQGGHARLTALLPRLHAVTNDEVLAAPDLGPHARALAHEGRTALHVRSGTLAARHLLTYAACFREAGAVVFLNDRADLVAAAGAQGLHLPAQGLPLSIARRLVGPDVLIGRSTHDPEAARAACEEGADYVFLGPIWTTASHPDHAPLGPAAIERARPARVIAIGGVTPARAAICRDAGAYGVAAISALWGAPDPAAVAAAMLLSFS